MDNSNPSEVPAWIVTVGLARFLGRAAELRPCRSVHGFSPESHATQSAEAAMSLAKGEVIIAKHAEAIFLRS